MQTKSLQTLLQDALKLCDSKLIALHIADEFIISEKFNLDRNFNKEEQIAYIALEAEKLLPYSLHEVYYDFIISNKGNENYEVILVACNKSYCDTYITLLQNLGYKTISLGIVSYLLDELQQQELSLKQLSERFSHLNHLQSSSFKFIEFQLAIASAMSGFKYAI